MIKWTVAGVSGAGLLSAVRPVVEEPYLAPETVPAHLQLTAGKTVRENISRLSSVTQR